MNRRDYLELARQGHAFPIATDLLLHETTDPAAILGDGRRLGQVVVASAERWQTPLAVPLMDLRVEKEAVLAALEVPPEQIDGFHFTEPPTAADVAAVVAALGERPSRRMQATCDAIAYVAAETDLEPLGMAIGPFSLMTKLLADPISAVYLAGTGETAEDDEDVAALEAVMGLCHEVAVLYARQQLAAGAGGLIVCEPAANLHYLSPRQTDPDLLEDYVLAPNRDVRRLCAEAGAAYLFHNCGELSDRMLERMAHELHPELLSLGSSRTLWHDAALVPTDVVLYGNLASRQFFNDQALSSEQVAETAAELRRRMAETGHPFILGTECDVLAVPGCEHTIDAKVRRLIAAA